MLFGNLNADIFTLFAGSNRHLYEAILVRVYRDLFRTEILFPSRTTVFAVIYEALRDHADLWQDDPSAETVIEPLLAPRGRRLRRARQEEAGDGNDLILVRTRLAYGRLRATGWLEESYYGLKTTVDMPAAAMQLAEFLCTLREGMTEQLGGLVVEVKNALDAVHDNARDHALGLHRAARDATSFGRYLRSVLSTLREVDRQVVSSGTVQARLQLYFEEFVEKLLLRDYAAITTTAHPYRFRGQILKRIAGIEANAADIEALAQVYSESFLAADTDGARDLVFDDLARISAVFDRIDEAFTLIQRHRARLEMRLRNTVRYAGRRTDMFLTQSEGLLAKLDRRLEEGDGADVPGPIETRLPVLSPALLARPRGVRAPIRSQSLVLAEVDAAAEWRQRLERDYQDRLVVTPQQVARFLERRLAPLATSEASRLAIETIDDFLAFEQLRLAVASGGGGQDRHPLLVALDTDFQFDSEGGQIVDNEWLYCAGFRITRRGDHVTLEGPGAR